MVSGFLFHEPGQRYVKIGIMMRVNIMENERPNMMANASGPHKEEAPASGIIPITVVIVVKNIGRRRETAASTIVSL